MSLSDVGKMCLFSSISGVITLDGKPVKNAKIRRSVEKAHTHGDKTDETTTNDKGYFEMPAVFDRSIISKILPMEFAVGQDIYVFYEGKEYKIWAGVKRKREENAESRGKPLVVESLVVECELNRETTIILVNGSPIISSCTWDVEPDPRFEFPPPINDEDI